MLSMMTIKKLNPLKIIIGLILFVNISCERKEENENPTISFLQPDTNLIITNDTLIKFIVEPYDKDGVIDRVEFTKNNTKVQTDDDSPYIFDWNISTEDNIGIYIIKAIAYDNHEAKGEAEIQIEINSYLTKWLGMYEGSSHHWSSYPTEINGQWQFVTYHTNKNVLVNVNKSSQDSCLDFTLTYDDSIMGTKNDLKFLVSGIHFSSWGGGSGYGSLDINFNSDSLSYYYFQKCGVHCSSGIDFVIGKK
jgi:hypothetical protein